MAKQDAEKRERPKKPSRAKKDQGTAPVKPTGRPSTYDPIKAVSICEQLSEGIPLREICRQPGMPAWRTVYDWMYQDEDLTAAIAHSRDLGWDAIAEDCFRIADTPMYGEEITESEDETGTKRTSVRKVDMLGHRKLQVETRLKLLAKFHPKKYGDALKLSGDKENPLRMEAEVKAKEMFDGVIEALEAARRKKS
jgi:hypothetical protein